MSNDQTSAVVILFLSVLLIVVSFMLNLSTKDSIWQTQAIEHEAAQFNPTTGAFEWIIEEKANE